MLVARDMNSLSISMLLWELNIFDGTGKMVSKGNGGHWFWWIARRIAAEKRT
jgi:hypothetical protein